MGEEENAVKPLIEGLQYCVDAVLAQSGKRRAYNSDLNVHLEPVDRDIVRPDACIYCHKSLKGFKNCGLRWINDSDLDTYLANFASQWRELQKEAEGKKDIPELGSGEGVDHEGDAEVESDEKAAEGAGHQKHHEDSLFRVWRCKTCDEFMANKVAL